MVNIFAMPMLIPDHKAVPKTIQSITKNGIDIDAVVRSSFSCAIRNNFINKISKRNTEKASKSAIKNSPTTTNNINNNNNNSINNIKILQSKKPCSNNIKNVTIAENTNNSITITNNKNNSKLILTTRNKHCPYIMSQKLPNNKPLNCTTNVAGNFPLQISHKINNSNDSKNNSSNSNDSNNNNNDKDILTNRRIKKEPGNENNELDDSLTSLQWLKDVKVQDLMEGKPIHYAPLSPAPSNEDDDERTSRLSSRLYSDSSVDYRVNSHVKPPYSYAALIIMAMKSTPCGKMTLSEIYKWITDNFVFYRKAEPSWQNSIRHNLSLNKCFAKLPRNKGDPGKGGYWKVVPEHADKLLETNIRKRRSSMIDYSCQEFIKRQKLELFESQLLMKIKEEVRSNASGENARLLSTNTLHQQSNYKNIYKHATAPQHQETLADVEQCRMDHPYGKNPYVKFVSDEDSIKALADNLQKTSNAFSDVIPSSSSASSINFDLSNSQVFNTFSSVIRSDCIWSSEHNPNENALTESMNRVKEELLEARNLTSNEEDTLLSKNLTNSLNSSGGFTTLEFCLSPPLSGEDDTLSADDLDEDLDSPFEGLDLTIHGTSMQILDATDEQALSNDVKREPLSPESIDLYTEE